MKSSTCLRAVVIAGAIMALSACSGSAVAESGTQADAATPTIFDTTELGIEFATERGYDLMASQLADSTITRDEYEISFERHVECLSDAGWVFDDAAAVWNPVDHLSLIRTGRAPDAPDREKQSVCDEQFEYISYLFQTTQQQRMDPSLLSEVRSCLRGEGVQFDTEASSLPEVVGAVGGLTPEADTVAECVNDGMELLYPGLGYSVAF